MDFSASVCRTAKICLIYKNYLKETLSIEGKFSMLFIFVFKCKRAKLLSAILFIETAEPKN